jgi:hypothetical protein
LLTIFAGTFDAVAATAVLNVGPDETMKDLGRLIRRKMLLREEDGRLVLQTAVSDAGFRWDLPDIMISARKESKQRYSEHYLISFACLIKMIWLTEIVSKLG